MIEFGDGTLFRSSPFLHMYDPYAAFHDNQEHRIRRNIGERSSAHGLSGTGTDRRVHTSGREVIIPIQVEGRSTPVQHIDLTGDENTNNSGLHRRSRLRRQHEIARSRNGEGSKSVSSTVSSFQVSKNVNEGPSSDTILLDEIIDLCMYEDMSDTDEVHVMDSNEKTSDCKLKSVETKSEDAVDASCEASGMSSKVLAPTPSYPVYTYLKTQLAKDGRLIDYIRGDGNCFFRALSKDIYGSEEFHDDVRQAVVDLIEKYFKKFEQYLDSGDSIMNHVKEMRKESTWASSVEIYAAATLLQRDIYVLSPEHTGHSYHWMLFKPRFIYTRDTSYHPCFITLCHTHGNHYDRITPKYGNCNCDYEPPVLSGVHAYVDLTK